VKHPRSRVNRRDLMRFRRPRTEPSAPNPVGPDALGSGDLLKASRPAMGSYFEIRVPANAPGAIKLAERVLDRIDQLEDQLTVYRDDSEVSRLNARAHEEPVVVEPGLFALLERAVAIGALTGGAYDVTSGALSLAWGFHRGPKRVPDPETLASARERTGQHLLRLDPAQRTVQFDRPGVAINLGSIGKGYAIDCAVKLVSEYWWPTSALIHGGRSSLFAFGSAPGQWGGRWRVALRNPFNPEVPLGELYLRNRAMGTSGTDFQQFEAGGRRFGHIIDPRTGEPPTEGPASVTVLAPTAAEADALSTAFYLLGPDAASAYVQEHPEIGAIFVNAGPTDNSPSVLTLGLSQEDYGLER